MDKAEFKIAIEKHMDRAPEQARNLERHAADFDDRARELGQHDPRIGEYLKKIAQAYRDDAQIRTEMAAYIKTRIGG